MLSSVYLLGCTCRYDATTNNVNKSNNYDSTNNTNNGNRSTTSIDNNDK